MDVCAGYEPLVEATRGGIVESLHLGALAAVDSEGNLLASYGDPDLVTFPRSSMKPFQVLPFVERDGVEHFGLNDEELAIMCASHSGTDEHVRVLKSLHEKVGIGPGDLQCGVHWPTDRETALDMRTRGEEPTSYRHNCSGKHSGMLAHARLRGLSLENYLAPVHPVQQSIRETVAEMCGLHPDDMIFGIDGCSAPVYAMPLSSFAWATARLMDPVDLDTTTQLASQKVIRAMNAYPTMVAGPGQVDTVLMQVMQGKVISKGGAEGFQLLGIKPGALATGSKGIGICFKIADGDTNRRATHLILAEFLKALGFGAEMDSQAYAPFNRPVIKNFRGIEVGRLRLARPISFFE
jgi:L-asparaginase II